MIEFTNNMKKKTRGGRRNPPGGRPAMPEAEKMKTLPIRFTPEQIKFLKSLPNAAAFVREAVDAYRKMK